MKFNKLYNTFKKKSILALILCFYVIACMSSMLSNNCKIKMSLNKMMLAKQDDKLIFNEGVLDKESFGEDSQNSYITPHENEIEYFYIFEDKIVNAHKNHDNVKANVSASDNSKLEIKSQISNGNSDFKDGYDLTAIEIIYKCADKVQDKIRVSMTVLSDQCDPFTIHWIKECSPKASLPSINIGVTLKSDEILKEGVFSNTVKAHDPESKYFISKEFATFTLYIAASNPERTIVMKEPKLNLNDQNLSYILKGALQAGGEITNIPQELVLAMACTPLKKSRTDIELTLNFDNNQIVNLFFDKECDTVEQIQAYFEILYIIYWILLILIVIFLFTVFIYYLKKNDLTLFEVYDRIKNYILFTFFKKPIQVARDNELSDHRDKLFDDNQIDVKISSSKIEKDHTRANNAQDYGGI